MNNSEETAAVLAAAHATILAQQTQARNLQATAAASQSASLPQYSVLGPTVQGSKYTQLLQIIDELGKDIRPTYTGNKICQERLKRSIIHARILVRECLLEAEKDRNNSSFTPVPTSSTAKQ